MDPWDGQRLCSEWGDGLRAKTSSGSVAPPLRTGNNVNLPHCLGWCTEGSYIECIQSQKDECIGSEQPKLSMIIGQEKELSLTIHRRTSDLSREWVVFEMAVHHSPRLRHPNKTILPHKLGLLQQAVEPAF